MHLRKKYGDLWPKEHCTARGQSLSYTVLTPLWIVCRWKELMEKSLWHFFHSRLQGVSTKTGSSLVCLCFRILCKTQESTSEILQQVCNVKGANHTEYHFCPTPSDFEMRQNWVRDMQYSTTQQKWRSMTGGGRILTQSLSPSPSSRPHVRHHQEKSAH